MDQKKQKKQQKTIDGFTEKEVSAVIAKKSATSKGCASRYRTSDLTYNRHIEQLICGAP